MHLSQRDNWKITDNGKRAIWLLITLASVMVVNSPVHQSYFPPALDTSFLNRAIAMVLLLGPALQAILTRTQRREGTLGALQHARVRELSRDLWIQTSLGFLLVLLVMLSNDFFALLAALAAAAYLDYNILQPLRAAKKEFTSKREASLSPRKAEDSVPRAAWGLAWAGWMLAVAIAAVGNMDGGAWPVLSHEAVAFFMMAASQLVFGPFLVRRSAQQPEPPFLQYPVLSRGVKTWGVYLMTLFFSVPTTICALAIARGWPTQWFGLVLTTAFVVSFSVGVAAYHLQQPQNPGDRRD